MALFSIIFFALSLFHFEIGVNGYSRHQVILYENKEPYCGGSIIGDNLILTAAHCVIDQVTNEIRERPILIAVGTDNRPKYNYELRVFRYVHRVVVHPNYQQPGKGFDIALLMLPSDFGPLANVQVLDVPSLFDSFDDVLAWGSSFGVGDPAYSYRDSHGYNVPSYPTGLNDYRAWVAKHGSCSDNWGEEFDSNLQMCNHVDVPTDEEPCYDNVGSGIAYNGSLIGIVSYSKKCNETDLEKRPTVYTKVSRFSEWIASPTSNMSRKYLLDNRFAPYDP